MASYVELSLHLSVELQVLFSPRAGAGWEQKTATVAVTIELRALNVQPLPGKLSCTRKCEWHRQLKTREPTTVAASVSSILQRPVC